jgi:hypothetical protein
MRVRVPPPASVPAHYGEPASRIRVEHDAPPDKPGHGASMELLDQGAHATTAAFLRREQERIVDAATATLGRARVRHYESTTPDDLRRRLEVLFDRLLDAVETRDMSGLLTHARAVAEQRFAAGYDLTDVQTAFNALEQSAWERVFAQLDPAEYGEVLRLVSTTLGAAKDTLAREYGRLAARGRVASLDLRALVAGCARP